MKQTFKKSIACIVAAIMLAVCMPSYSFASDDEDVTNKISLGTEYKVSELGFAYYGQWALQFTAPQQGRIKVWVKNYNTDIYHDLYSIDVEPSSSWYGEAKWSKSADTMNSGWISVSAGTHLFCFKRAYADYRPEEESLFVEFQPINAYTGEAETNDSFSQATTLTSGTTYEGNYSGITDPSYKERNIDEDYYQFELENYSLVKINIKNMDPNTKTVCNVPFTLYREDENGNRKVVLKEKDVTSKETKEHVRLPKGKYYMKLRADAWSSREYTIRIDIIDESAEIYEREFNNFKSDATQVISKKKYTGNLNSNEDVDWFKVELENDGLINVELWKPEAVGANNLQITLYDPDMKKLYSKTSGSDVYYASKKKTVSAGIYYVCIKSGSNGLESIYDYQMRVNAVPIIKPVSNLKATLTDYKTYKITWKPSKGADGYNIYAKKGAKGQYIKKGFTTENMFSAEGLTAGSKYDFVVAPCLLSDEKYEEVEYALNNVSAYTLKKVTQNKVKKASASKVQISWKDINGESGYEICKMTKKDGAYAELSKYKTSKTSIKITAKKGVKYYYKVRAYKKIGSAYIYAPWSAVKAYQL